jgi:hypothetical protein
MTMLSSSLPRTGLTKTPIVLGRRANLWVSAGVVAHTLWTSAAPAMVYRLYAQEWHLSHTVTTGIFAIYPIVVVAVLIGFGDLSDHIGRRATMLMGLGASLAGTLLFAVAPGVLWLFAGRALMGIGVGLTAGPSTAAVVEFSSGGWFRARSSEVGSTSDVNRPLRQTARSSEVGSTSDVNRPLRQRVRSSEVDFNVKRQSPSRTTG